MQHVTDCLCRASEKKTWRIASSLCSRESGPSFVRAQSCAWFILKWRSKHNSVEEHETEKNGPPSARHGQQPGWRFQNSGAWSNSCKVVSIAAGFQMALLRMIWQGVLYHRNRLQYGALNMPGVFSAMGPVSLEVDWMLHHRRFDNPSSWNLGSRQNSGVLL